MSILNGEVLEQQQEQLETQISQPDFYRGSAEQTQIILDTLQSTQQQLEQAYQRWDELEKQL